MVAGSVNDYADDMGTLADSLFHCTFAAVLKRRQGDVSEWLKEHAWKVCIRETVSRVRISPSPPKIKASMIANRVSALPITHAYFLLRSHAVSYAV